MIGVSEGWFENRLSEKTEEEKRKKCEKRNE